MRLFEVVRARPARLDGVGVRRGPYYRIAEFLPEETAARVLADIIDRRGDFRPLTGDRNFLRLPEPLGRVPGLSEHLAAILPRVQRALGIDLADPAIELYLHAYGDGTRFGRHSDAHGGGNWRRRISCVYYLHRRPRPFEGGNLVIHDGRGRAHPVAPEHNSAVFFPSHVLHEVLPVTSRSRRFEDSRFAINVWIM